MGKLTSPQTERPDVPGRQSGIPMAPHPSIFRAPRGRRLDTFVSQDVVAETGAFAIGDTDSADSLVLLQGEQDPHSAAS